MGRSVLTLGIVIVLAGCSGDSGPERTLEGGTAETNLGIAVVVDRVELDDADAHAYITVRNPSGSKVLFDPSAATLKVDGDEYTSRPTTDYSGLVVDVGSGGGESSGALLFPGVPADGTDHVLHLEGESPNTSIGDDGRFTWDVPLD